MFERPWLPCATALAARRGRGVALHCLVGGAVFIGLMVGGAGIYDAVSKADGISGPDKRGRSRPPLEFAVLSVGGSQFFGWGRVSTHS